MTRDNRCVVRNESHADEVDKRIMRQKRQLLLLKELFGRQ